MSAIMSVTIGIDPHKSTRTAVAVDRDEHRIARLILAADRHQTDRLLAWAEPLDVDRVWAIESAAGLGRLLAQQLIAAGERVVDVPPTLAARVRLLGPSKALAYRVRTRPYRVVNAPTSCRSHRAGCSTPDPPTQVGPRGTPLGNGETYTQPVAGTNGNCTIPAAATAIAMNVTTVNGTSGSFLTVWPADATRPVASNLNWVAGAPATPNKVDIKLSADGKVSIYNLSGTVDVLADIVGFYAADNSVHSDNYNEISMVFTNMGATGVTMSQVPGSCLGNSGVTNAPGRVSLVIPVGARLVSVDVAMFDGAPLVVGQYTVFLVRDALGASSQSSSAIAPPVLGGGQTNVIVHHLLIPTAAEIVDSTESFHLEIGSFSNNDNGFCQATVTYDTDG